jgi:hypothetical protein
MFVIGIVSSTVSMLTFAEKKAQTVGCGFFLFSTSLVSMLTIIMLTLKLTFLLLAQMTYITDQTFLRTQCTFVDFALRTCLTFHDWLNAYVTVERAITVTQGINFNKARSKQRAKWVVVLLFLVIITTNLHEPIYRSLITDEEEQRTWCIVRYPSFIELYNSVIQVFHFLLPFALNIISALIIVFSISRIRFIAQNQYTFENHFYEQLSRNKHLLISPIILVLLALPRLIIALMSGCVKATRDPWLFLTGYFTYFIPSLLVFVVFVLPSKLYKAQCKQTLMNLYRRKWCRRPQ